LFGDVADECLSELASRSLGAGETLLQAFFGFLLLLGTRIVLKTDLFFFFDAIQLFFVELSLALALVLLFLACLLLLGFKKGNAVLDFRLHVDESAETNGIVS
jgi:hypothetical protein